eukprot:GHVQ01001733.1.p1 GENE.GHVQ01001733.1~~GHVQ01001733.1.p1  ORF type:complete len:125 (+),score=13.39 GHVQ01001733.1:97-471(+)
MSCKCWTILDNPPDCCNCLATSPRFKAPTALSRFEVKELARFSMLSCEEEPFDSCPRTTAAKTAKLAQKTGAFRNLLKIPIAMKLRNGDAMQTKGQLAKETPMQENYLLNETCSLATVNNTTLH